MSFLSPTGFSEHSCGYCHASDCSSKSHGAWAYSLSPLNYQLLIDHGWRRSGQYLYKPTQDTCCFTYTIRLNTSMYKITKGNKKSIKKIRKYTSSDETVAESPLDVPENKALFEKETEYSTEKRLPEALKYQSPSVESFKFDLRPNSDLTNQLILAETKFGNSHDINVIINASAFEMDTFELYCKYQQKIHKDPIEKLTIESFKRFLVNSPLQHQKVAGTPGYGSFHQKYYFGDKLVAVGVIDILPFCVSSVYFMYDPDFSFLSLGVYGALREIGLTSSLSAVIPELKYYYMGYYIHSCPKMRYKAQYKPSELACPFTYKWAYVEKAYERIEKNPVTALYGPDMNIVKHSSKNIRDAQLSDIRIFARPKCVLYKDANLDDDSKESLKLMIDVLGEELAKEFIYVF